ncbi:sterol C-14 reductase-like protein [Pseudovirgaria hyperparasitica]|uniref:Delta(14)-sterol reductase n=1 Tax=Pseudovirgaria hyperparasitica TaxID=470096 RepID=A0A6A6W5P1_9PEZI|nr:sterol C-14 reductase-like protein [Pseudovirgaria hyperparasitica]KAF2757865.1 sterol C-14 reductase-like protein [Pseudovirgaria hyperparasitica]
MAPKTSKASSTAAPSEKHGYEFMGPPGAFLISIGLPILCYVFAFGCNDVSGCPIPSLLHPTEFNIEDLKRDIGWKGIESIINLQSILATVGWYIYLLTLTRFLPATEIEGVELDSGGKLKYRLNTFNIHVFTLAIAAAGTLYQGADWPIWVFLWENTIPLLTTNLVFAYALATFVYIRSFSVKPGNKELRELAKGGQSGNMLYDWFIGRELNPRITLPVFGEIDIKSWMELRPGMIAWVVINLSNIAAQYRHYGHVTDSILFITFAQAFYTLDGQYMEPAILTTIDIIADGFGFMLAFGDVPWLPFTYSIHTRYLAVHPVQLGPLRLLGVFAVQASGYALFRAVNNEKNRFRTNPKDPRIAHLEYIETESGSKLLTTGWWGTARHINYLGDWLMSWSFCLPTAIAGYVIERDSIAGILGPKKVVPGEAKGWGMLFTYFFMIYFAVLLIHRERRDEEKCRRKYGKDWDRYVEKVPYRIIPYVY